MPAPSTAKRRTGWAIAIALLMIVSIALLLRYQKERSAELERHDTEVIARNAPTPPPAPTPPVVEPETPVIEQPIDPGEVDQAAADRAAAEERAARERAKAEDRAAAAERDRRARERAAAERERADAEQAARAAAEQEAIASAEPETKVETIPPAIVEERPVEDAEVQIVYREDLRGLRTEKLALTINGQPIPFKGDSRNLNPAAGITLFSGILPAGQHEVALRVKMRGDAQVFDYIESYAFNVDHHGKLQVSPEHATKVTINAVRLKGLTKDWIDRVGLSVDVNVQDFEQGVAALESK